MELKINCHCVTMLLFLNNNKLALNDQVKCFVITACIFLSSTMILTACRFSLYILGLDNIISDHFYCIRVTIKYYMNTQFILLTLLLIMYKDTINFDFCLANTPIYNVSV